MSLKEYFAVLEEKFKARSHDDEKLEEELLDRLDDIWHNLSEDEHERLKTLCRVSS